MFVLENHFNYNSTILIHNRIINGCQDFTLEEAEPILYEYGVSDEEWQQVLSVYTGNSTDEQIMQFIEHEDWHVVYAIAQHGNDKYRDLLIANGSMVCAAIACCIAQYGNDEHRDKLIDHENTHVRNYVAKFGNHKHRVKLAKDSTWKVRYTVARYGDKSHCQMLSNDTNRSVRSVASRRLRGL